MRRYGPLLRYIIAPILPDEREQEECLSDIYWKIWEKIASFDPLRGSLRAWPQNGGSKRRKKNVRRCKR